MEILLKLTDVNLCTAHKSLACSIYIIVRLSINYISVPLNQSSSCRNSSHKYLSSNRDPMHLQGLIYKQLTEETIILHVLFLCGMTA